VAVRDRESIGRMTLGETPRYEKAKELEIVLDHYLDPDDMISEEFMESAVWHCPECREASFVAKFGWAKAGCLREECTLPKSMSPMELIAYFEDLDPKTDKRSIYKKRKEILEEAHREEELERQDEERRRREREEAKRRAEVQRQAELRRVEEAARRERDLRAQAEELYGPEELEEVIAEKREQQRKEAERAAKERLRSWREKTEGDHRATVERTIRAETRVTAGELALSLAVLAAVAYSFYWAVGRLYAFAEYVPYSGLGIPEPESESWALRGLRGLVETLLYEPVVSYRLWIGLVLGAAAGGYLWWWSSARRRTEARFADEEALEVVSYDAKVRGT
jgi:hypothetical protein